MSNIVLNNDDFTIAAAALNIHSLSELSDYSLEQVVEKVGDKLAYANICDLYHLAEVRNRQNITRERQVITHANPQLLKVEVLKTPPASFYGNDFIPVRDEDFVPEGHVGSMFSPAAYLTELYREAQGLHDKNSNYHIDRRRPDLKDLSLSQENLDTPVPLLTLSNEMLQKNIKEKLKIASDRQVYEVLAENKAGPSGPFHHAFAGVKASLDARDAQLSALLPAESRPEGTDQIQMLCTDLGISPSLYALRSTELNFDNVDAEYQKVFGNTLPEELLNANVLAERYGLPVSLFDELLAGSVLKAKDTEGKYINNTLCCSTEINGTNYFIREFRTFVGYRAWHESIRFHWSGLAANNRSLSYTYTSTAYPDRDTQRVIWKNDQRAFEQNCTFKDLSKGVTAAANYRLGLQTFEFNHTNDIKAIDTDFDRSRVWGITCVIEFHSSYSWLLTLHHQVLLHRALGLSLPLIARLQARYNTPSLLKDERHNSEVKLLQVTSAVLRYQRDYGLDEETASTLAGLHLDVHPADGRRSQFDRVFNMCPPKGLDLGYTPTRYLKLEANAIPPKEVIYWERFQYALGLVSNAELVALNNLVFGYGYLSESQEILSHLYRGKLLADIHGLSVAELAQLLPLLGFKKTLIWEDFIQVVDKVHTAIAWMKTHQLTLADLIVMTTGTFDTTLTPEISALIVSLKDSIDESVDDNGNTIILNGRPLMKALAPHFNAVLGLTTNSVEYLLNRLGWSEVDTFWRTVRDIDTSNMPHSAKIASAITFCHQVAQLALIAQRLSLSESELDLVLEYPKRLSDQSERVELKEVSTMMLLTRSHDVFSQAGDSGSALLVAFRENTLEIKHLAKAFGQPEKIIEATLKAMGAPEALRAFHITHLLQLQDWLRASQMLAVDCDTLSQLYTKPFTTLPYATLQNLSDTLQKSLSQQRRDAITDKLDTALSTALCEYYLHEIRPAGVTLNTRDDLFSFLLMDNQVSAEIMTSRVAEAISSIQLYINRCLYEPQKEGDVINSALKRTFFTDWETYNKRYSTWAGVSMLAYFPENYVDPTARLGQTSMMDTLLQTLSQSQLTPDSVEDAFNAYLTAFEKISDLSVISGYYNGVNINGENTYSDRFNPNEGKTYFVGQSQAEVPAYYWRSLKNRMFSDGKFPANAWTEWKAITASATPHLGLVRPVVFRDRLYLLWLEQHQVKGSDNTTDHWAYMLKLSFLRYDGAWSEPLTLHKFSTQTDSPTEKDSPFKQDILKLLNSSQHGQLGFYCANENNADLLHVILYQLGADSSKYDEKTKAIYWTVDASLECVLQPTAPMGNIQAELDSTGERKIANTYVKTGLELKKIGPQDGINPVKYDGENKDQLTFSVGAYLTEKEKKELDAYHRKSAYHFKLNIPNSTNLLADVYCYPDESDKYFWIFYKTHINPVGRVYGGLSLVFASSSSWGMPVSMKPGIDNAKKLTIPEGKTYDSYMKDIIGMRVDATSGISRNVIYNTRGSSIPQTSIPDISFDLKTIFSLTVHDGGKLINESKNKGDKNITLDCVINGASNRREINLSMERTLTSGLYKKRTSTIIRFERKPSDMNNVLHLKMSAKKAQYLEWKGTTTHRVRLNTLFARELVKQASKGLDVILSRDTQFLKEPALGTGADEPMDFSGANALYFWELFYYLPMLVAQRLLQEQQFDQATRWFNFVFNPMGYNKERTIFWNTRPLEEDTRWNEIPLDSTDPDAVAQSDPMHYKVATLIRRIELYIARGDQAYRRLERDSMNEAKMWYLQALGLMGSETLSKAAPWSEQTLSAALASLNAKSYALEGYQIAPAYSADGAAYTANSLVSLFKPQKNGLWHGLRQKLTQRMYNLRHGLNLDGQPLSLPLFASPADPAELQNAALSASQGGTSLPQGIKIGLQRFPQSLDNARNLVGQLIQCGSTLLNVIERQDAEQMAGLMQEQSQALMAQSLGIQKQAQAELEMEKVALTTMRDGATTRKNHYKALYDGDISDTEKHIMRMRKGIMGAQAAAAPLLMTGSLAQMAPNIFGMANGGSNWGAVATGTGIGIQFGALVTQTVADGLAESESYRRRRQEWEIMWKNAENEEAQIEAQLNILALRQKGTELQLTYMQTQQAQLQAQLSMMQRKFSNEKLFGWMRGRLSALYFQFYDQVVSRCLRAEAAFKWETGQKSRFIKPGAWQSTWAGLLCGEGLSLSLTEMETAYQNWEGRALEVERTVSLNKHIEKLQETIRGFVRGKPIADSKDITLSSKTLSVSVALSKLELQSDYPEDLKLGKVRRIKQISVTLPGLVGPYQDIQAVLSYGGSTQLPAGCTAIAISRGMNDSGQFQLDFNDGKYLPFEGINIGDTGNLTLRFPNATTKQKTLLDSLSDIIFHVRYTIRD